MTTKVTDKGIIYPDGTKQTTAAYGSGDGDFVDAYTKEETDNKFYDKEEIDSLIEGSSDAIVANYKNKAANSLARDPQAGNLYLVATTDFTTEYEKVTRIFISDTDGDGTVRNFDELKADDNITLTSEVGSGEYTIVTVSDMGGYRELLVNIKSATGIVPDNTDLSIVLDVASSDEGEAQPPVVFQVRPTSGTDIEYPSLSANFLDLSSITINIDTDSGIDKDKDAYVVPRDGIYKFDIGIFYLQSSGAGTSIKVIRDGSTHYSSPYQYLQDFDNPFVSYTSANNQIIECKKGDEVKVEFWGKDKDDSGNYQIRPNRCWFSGHMITGQSTGTGGGVGGIEEAPEDGKQYARKDGDWSEVKATSGGDVGEQTPIAFEVKASENQSLTTAVIEKLVFGETKLDTDNAFDSTNNSYVVPRDGIMQINAGALLISEDQYVNNGMLYLYKNDVEQIHSHLNNKAPLNKPNDAFYLNSVIEVKKDDVLDIRAKLNGAGVLRNSTHMTYFSGHMVSSITSVVDTAIGMVAPFAMDSVPKGWLHCDGSAVSRDTYSLLYSKVGDTYGAGDGSTTFNLPDLQDEFIRGSSDTLAVGNKQDDEFKAHNHYTAKKINNPNDGNMSFNAQTGSLTSGNVHPDVSTSIEGGSETRPRNVAMLYCINATAEPSSSARSGGDSIWTEVNGEAVYDNDIKVNDVTVGSKNQPNTTIVGRNALPNMTTGTHNTALGYGSLRELTEGTHNTALGMQSLLKNQTGKNNIAIGHNSLQETLSDNNTAIGYKSGADITTGTNNTCIGYNAQPSAPTVSNEVTIGNNNVTNTRVSGNGLLVGVSAQTSETSRIKIGSGRTGSGLCYLDFITEEGADYNSRIQREAGANGSVKIVNTGSGALYFNNAKVITEGSSALGGGGVPIGAIMMWSGATNTIPSGWRLCDGGGGTPDLRNRFPVGAGSTYALKATGGSANAVIVEHNHSGSVTINNKTGLDGTLTLINRGGSSGANSLMRARSGSVTTATSGQGSYGEGWRGESGSNSSKATFKLNHNHTGSISISNKGSTGVDKNLPPYIALYYIMKTSSSRSVDEEKESSLIEKLSARIDELEKRVK